MARTGADPEQLDALARTLAQTGGELTQIGKALRSLIADMCWHGPDAERFQTQFVDQERQFARVADSLGASAQGLRRQAIEQRQASSTGALRSDDSRSHRAGGTRPTSVISARTARALHAYGLNPALTAAEYSTSAALARNAGLITHNGQLSIDPGQAVRWLSQGPAIIAQLDSLTEQFDLGMPSAVDAASALLGLADTVAPSLVAHGVLMDRQFSQSFELGAEHQSATSGQLGFTTYDARLRAFLGVESAVSGEFSAGIHGLAASGTVAAFVGTSADGAMSLGTAGMELSASGLAMVGAEAQAVGQAEIGWDQVGIDGTADAFAGAAVEFNSAIGGHGASATYGAGLRAGAGVELGGSVDFGMDKVGFETNVGAALGVGIDVNVGVSFNPNQAVGAVGWAGSELASGASAVADAGTSFVKSFKKLGGFL